MWLILLRSNKANPRRIEGCRWGVTAYNTHVAVTFRLIPEFGFLVLPLDRHGFNWTGIMDEAMATFIKYMRSEAARSLHRKPFANHLLSIIANRVRYNADPVNGLQPGQCFIGDYLTTGMSRQRYRTALRLLKSNQIITTKSTNRGTVVTLIDSDIYDINTENQPSKQPATNHPSTNKQPSGNHQTTSQQPLNKKGKKDKKEKTYKNVLFDEFWNAYPGPRAKTNRQGSLKVWLTIDPSLYEQIIKHVLSRRESDPEWLKEDGQFILGPTPFLNQQRWEDEWTPQTSSPAHKEYIPDQPLSDVEFRAVENSKRKLNIVE